MQGREKRLFIERDGKREDYRRNSMNIERKVPYGRIQIRVLGNVVAICKKLSYNEKNY